jgi:hypothetical protein
LGTYHTGRDGDAVAVAALRNSYGGEDERENLLELHPENFCLGDKERREGLLVVLTVWYAKQYL